MAKLPALWTARDGSSTVTQTSGHLLFETSGGLLLESSATSYLLLEDVSVAPKEATSWSAAARPSATQYISQDGYSIITTGNASVQRTQQDTVVRILQDGTVRVLEDTVVMPKYPTDWNDT
jgi:hypothetical protein